MRRTFWSLMLTGIAVTALAGFVNAASGRTFVTVVMLNHPTASQGTGEAIQTALVQWVFGQ